MISALLVLSAGPAWAIDREDVLDSAAAYAAHEWTMTSVNETAECLSDYESDYSAGTWYGLPYDWGGYMTLDEYDDQIDDGYGAGSHSWHGILWCTAGVDCSGYISQVWGTGHYSTSTFYSVTADISTSDLERADAVNDAGSHMVLYTYETDAGNPVFYEASGSAEKVRLNSTSGWSYLSGYQPIRFDDIEDGPSSGTELAPREITAFPFEDQRWTAGAASDVLDAYACAPSTDESGPEMLYRFEAATSGTLHAVVSDDSTVDIDLHVLTSPDGDDCIARDDVEIEVEVGPGEVWLALDTYVGSQEFPGPYVLTATFTGELGQAPIDTGEGPGPDTDTGVPDTDTLDTDDTDDALDSVDSLGVRVPLFGQSGGCSTSSGPGRGWSLGGGIAAMVLALVALVLRPRRP
jgi:hypothetical protein